MQVWDGASNGHIWLDADEAGVDSMATMVENDVLQHAFNQRMDELDSIEIIRGATVTDVSYRRRDETGDGFATLAESTHSSCAAVSLDSGDEVLGKLVVGSDGPRSVVKTKGGFGSMGWRYDQTALVATVRVSAAGPNDIAWQRFLPTGPVALLPLSPTVSSVVWSTTAERAAALVQLPPTEFVAELNDALNGEMSGRAGTQGDAASDEGDAVTAELQRLGGKLAQYIQTVSSTAMAGGATTRRDPPLAIGVDDGSRASFPLSFANANHYVRPRLALAGDAAHKVHPLAGQGLNLGLGDAEELAAIIADDHAVGLDPGDIHGLMR
jgi:ubiquinone biosynthesis monooxygenase Coq6